MLSARPLLWIPGALWVNVWLDVCIQPQGPWRLQKCPQSQVLLQQRGGGASAGQGSSRRGEQGDLSQGKGRGGCPRGRESRSAASTLSRNRLEVAKMAGGMEAAESLGWMARGRGKGAGEGSPTKAASGGGARGGGPSVSPCVLSSGLAEALGPVCFGRASS